MRIADLAKELKVTEPFILKKIKELKLRAKDDAEITAGVEMILRDALADEGIGKHVVEEEEKPKKAVKIKKPKRRKDGKRSPRQMQTF